MLFFPSELPLAYLLCLWASLAFLYDALIIVLFLLVAPAEHLVVVQALSPVLLRHLLAYG